MLQLRQVVQVAEGSAAASALRVRGRAQVQLPLLQAQSQEEVLPHVPHLPQARKREIRQPIIGDRFSYVYPFVLFFMLYKVVFIYLVVATLVLLKIFKSVMIAALFNHL